MCSLVVTILFLFSVLFCFLLFFLLVALEHLFYRLLCPPFPSFCFIFLPLVEPQDSCERYKGTSVFSSRTQCFWCYFSYTQDFCVTLFFKWFVNLFNISISLGLKLRPCLHAINVTKHYFKSNLV